MAQRLPGFFVFPDEVFPMTHAPDQEGLAHAIQEASPAFRAWAGTDAPVMRGLEISACSFQGSGPYIAYVHHGTTHDFSVFSADKLGNHEGAFGKVNYFTTALSDADRNYAGMGPDLTQRIGCEAEQMTHEIEHDPEAYGLDEDADYDACLDKAKEIVGARLNGGSPQVLSLYVRMDRPFVIDGCRKPGKLRIIPDTSPLLFPDLEDAHADAEEEVLINNRLEHLEGDARSEALEDLEDEVYEALDAMRESTMQKLADLFVQIASELGAPAPDVPDDIFCEISEMTHNGFYQAIKGSEEISMLEGEDGLVSSQFLSRLIERLGYDGIVIRNVDRHFENMQIPTGAAHIHIFDAQNHRIKSTTNRGSFSPDDPDIYA